MSKMSKFIKELVNNVYWGTGNPDEPECPQCGEIMKFHGSAENLPIGDGYWECSNCGFKYNESDLDYDKVDDFWI